MMTDIEKKYIDHEVVIREHNRRLEDIETKKWYKSSLFWAGFLALPTFILFGRALDFFTEHPHFSNIFHHGIGTPSILTEEIKSSKSPIRKAVLDVVTSDLMKPSETFVQAFELGAVNSNSLVDCLKDSKPSEEPGEFEHPIVTTEDSENSSVFESKKDCNALTYISKKSNNSLFSIKANNLVDISLEIGVSNLVFDEVSNQPLYASVTNELTSQFVLNMVKFSFGNGTDIDFTQDGNGILKNLKFGDELLQYYMYGAKGISLPENISLDHKSLRILNTRLESEIENTARISFLIMISPNETKNTSEDGEPNEA